MLDPIMDDSTELWQANNRIRQSNSARPSRQVLPCGTSFAVR